MVGHQYAKSIWAEQPIESNGFLVTKINAETELFKYPTRSTQKETLLPIEMMKTSLSGLIIHPEDYKITLRCGAYIHEENRSWLGKIFSLAAIIQVIDVEDKGNNLALMLKLQPDKSDHPDSGVRNDAVYVTFIPAIVCTPGILFNMCISIHPIYPYPTSLQSSWILSCESIQ